MAALFLKEINSFFSSLTGYLALSVFLVLTGLFLWVFPDTSLLEYGYAGLDQLFVIAPWVFMFLIPAITMRTFSEEIRTGTYELLATRPLSNMAIIGGKYLAALFLVVFSLLPTLIAFYSVYELASPPGNVDTGAIWGSYVGLLLLGASFTAIGVFCSSLSGNQIVAFILAVFMCFFLFIAFEFLSSLGIFYAKVDHIIQLIGINEHYSSLSRGVVDSRDLVYFFSVIFLFLGATRLALEARKS